MSGACTLSAHWQVQDGLPTSSLTSRPHPTVLPLPSLGLATQRRALLAPSPGPIPVIAWECQRVPCSAGSGSPLSSVPIPQPAPSRAAPASGPLRLVDSIRSVRPNSRRPFFFPQDPLTQGEPCSQRAHQQARRLGAFISLGTVAACPLLNLQTAAPSSLLPPFPPQGTSLLLGPPLPAALLTRDISGGSDVGSSRKPSPAPRLRLNWTPTPKCLVGAFAACHPP